MMHWREVDVMNLTFAQRTELPDTVAEALNMDCRSVAGLHSVAELRARLLRCIHWHTLNAVPLSLAYLNRLFGRAAHRLQTRVGAELLDLTAEGAIVAFEKYSAKQSVVARVPWEEVQAQWIAMGTEFEAEARMRWSANVR